ncbi:MAG: cache domain-containing protein, partial [Proteobacteria bacterium]|nr:cache domain-containing protein [Pseudomonadota bacterium]
AQAMLTRAIDALKADPKQALADFQTLGGRFMMDDLYVFVIDLADGRFLAHGANPELVGRDGKEVRDAKGKAITLDMINIARRKGAGELDYVWRNPTTGKPESKHSYFRTVDGRLIGVGYFTR